MRKYTTHHCTVTHFETGRKCQRQQEIDGPIHEHMTRWWENNRLKIVRWY